MQLIIHKIEEFKLTLDSLMPMKPEFQKKLDEKFRLEYNYNSNHLEGNTLTYTDTKLLLIFGKTNGGSHEIREYEEMKAHDVALKLIENWAKDTERPITEVDIKELNKIILVEPFWKDAITPDRQSTRRQIKIGDYKEFPNSVILQNGETFEYASPLETPIKMGELIKWLREEESKNELHPIALAALLHYKFVCIHPFDDGNGRISRLLMNYILLKNNFPPIVIKSKDKKNYLNALNMADSGDTNSFIEYIALQLIWSLELSIKAAKGEEIEESEDIDKEISIWKKNLKVKSNNNQKNNSAISSIFSQTIQPFITLFCIKHQQLFDLFESASSELHINKGYIANLENDFDFISSTLREIFNMRLSSPHNNSIDNIRVIVNLINLKTSRNEKLSINSELEFELTNYGYRAISNSKTIEKRYDESINEDGQNEIIKDSIKAVFAEIQKKSK